MEHASATVNPSTAGNVNGEQVPAATPATRGGSAGTGATGTTGTAGTTSTAGATDARRARWDGHRAARRAELVAAAIRVIGARGPTVGMDDIAAEAGVSKPVLYRHFTDKAALHVAVGRHAAGALLATLQAELDDERAPREHLRAVVDAYLRAIEAQPDLYRFVTRGPVGGTGPDLVSEYMRVVADRVSHVVRGRLAEAGRDDRPAEPWGRGVVGMVQAVGDWWLDNRHAGREELAEYLTAMVWDGLGGTLADGAVADT